jgi:citrate lyase alpha subunit
MYKARAAKAVETRKRWKEIGGKMQDNADNAGNQIKGIDITNINTLYVDPKFANNVQVTAKGIFIR